MIKSIPFPEYLAHPGINAHYLMDMIQRSPAHARWNKDHPQEDTPSLAFGRAFHAAVLEPATLLDRFVCIPEDLDRRTKAGKDEYAKLCATGKTLLKLEDMHRVTAMQAAIREHRTARELIGWAMHVEASVFWEQSGFQCKARLDAVSGSAVVDLKTTTDASKDAFTRTIQRYGYHIQAAWYMAAARAAGLNVDRFVFVAVETSAPYGVAAYTLDEGYLMAAEHAIQNALELHRQCEKVGHWHGYADEEQTVLCPAWLIEEEYA
jgi:exodeoxyribonuclease VIII